MSFLKWTDYVVKTPSVGGLTHLFAVLFTLFLSLIASKTAKKVTNKKADMIVLLYGLFILVLEIYKQLYMTYILNDGIYGWSYFPYQFCSVPMYVALICPFIKNLKRLVIHSSRHMGYWQEVLSYVSLWSSLLIDYPLIFILFFGIVCKL